MAHFIYFIVPYKLVFLTIKIKYVLQLLIVIKVWYAYLTHRPVSSIKDFESDCRNFLTHFNEGLSDKKLVWSFPMMFCTVEGRSLVKPEDLAEFWIDFNLGPGTVSFYYTFKVKQ